jgi:peptidoglycan/xylan/chitin deacetylase (PgdA/CDA1 family)
MLLLPSRLPRKLLALGRRWPGLLSLARPAGSVVMLRYQGVTPRPLPVFNRSQLPLAEFEQQIEFLASQYSILHLREVIERFNQHKPLPRNAAVLTFDDGFRNVLTTAYPVLERHRLPATVFLVTGLIGSCQPAWPERLYHAVASTRKREVVLDDLRWAPTSAERRAAAFKALSARLRTMPAEIRDARLAELHRQLEVPAEIPPKSPLYTLEWPEIEQLSRTGLIDFGSQTHSRATLSQCTAEIQRDELTSSRDTLRERLGRCELLAYPDGTAPDFNEDSKRLAAELGYTCALSSLAGLNLPHDDRFALRRLSVGADTTLEAFESRLAAL